MDVKIIGCGLTGAVIGRTLADCGHTVQITERRDHFGGNRYDYVDEHGVLVQQYGPHIFHTNNADVYEFVNRFEQWKSFRLVCGAVWDDKYTPTPFNFTTIDTFFSGDQAEEIKRRLKAIYPDAKTVTILELLNHTDSVIRHYAEYLFQNDYAPYTAKQWGVSPEEIDASILRRVPVRMSYHTGYFNDHYEMMPQHSYTYFIRNILNHPRMRVQLNDDGLEHLGIGERMVTWDGQRFDGFVVFTGALDELFDRVYGGLPYRSLRFEWMHSDTESLQPVPVVAYPQAKGYTRITEYKKLPIQNVTGTSYAIEYPIPYNGQECMEPFYPMLTEESKRQYEKYRHMADEIPSLYCCGRLADFKYYNMDEAIDRALHIAETIRREMLDTTKER